jgi:hypothetical protein
MVHKINAIPETRRQAWERVAQRCCRGRSCNSAMISPGRRGGRSRARCSAGLTLRTSSRELALFISFIATIAAFDRDRSGNIAIILAPAVIVVLGFVGVAVDYDAPIPATRSTSASSSATVTTGAGDPIGHDVSEVVTGLHTLDEEVRVSVGVSVGIAMSPEHGNEAETLLLAIRMGPATRPSRATSGVAVWRPWTSTSPRCAGSPTQAPGSLGLGPPPEAICDAVLRAALPRRLRQRCQDARPGTDALVKTL